MKKFMQVGLFMGTFLLSSQLFGQTTEKRGEYPVSPKTEKSDVTQTKVNQAGKKKTKLMVDPNFRVPTVAERKESR